MEHRAYYPPISLSALLLWYFRRRLSKMSVNMADDFSSVRSANGSLSYSSGEYSSGSAESPLYKSENSISDRLRTNWQLGPLKPTEHLHLHRPKMLFGRRSFPPFLQPAQVASTGRAEAQIWRRIKTMTAVQRVSLPGDILKVWEDYILVMYTPPVCLNTLQVSERRF